MTTVQKMLPNEQIFNDRLVNVVMYIVLCQVLITNSLVLLFKFMSFHPIIGIQDWIHLLFNGEAFTYHIALCFLAIVFTGVHKQNYKVELTIHSTRLESLLSSISPHRLFHMFLLSGLASLNVYCYISLFWIASSNGRKATLLESSFLGDTSHSLFLICHGLFAGASFSWKYFSCDWYLLKFTLVQQRNFTFLCSKVTEIMSNSISNVVRPLYWYYILYILLGPLVMHLLSFFFEIQQSTHLTAILYSLISPKLLFATVATGSMLHFSWCIAIAIFSAFMTRGYEFPLETSSEKLKADVLTNALTCTVSGYLQYLGYLDLRLLAQFSVKRRQMFFTISHPGGHPYNWQQLSNTCSTRLSQFIMNISKLTLEKPNGVKKFSPVKKGERSCFPAVKVLKPVDNPNNPLDRYQKVVEDYIKNMPLYKYFTDELPDIDALRLFTSCQLEIWTVEALGFFISSSYTEDKLGVVQQTLPKLLCLLIDLKLVEEKLPLGVMSFKKYAKDSKSLHIAVSQRHNLKSALESTLYRIVLTFKNDIRGVAIPEEHRRYLQKYLEFRQ